MPSVKIYENINITRYIKIVSVKIIDTAVIIILTRYRFTYIVVVTF
jgi:hypothetical protein